MDDLESVEYNELKMSDINFELNQHGIGHELFYHMKNSGHLLAQIDVHTEERDTYDNLLQRCIRTALQLKARNISANDVICICSYNHLNSCVPYLAGLFIGAIVCCLDPQLSFSDTRHLLSQVKPKIIFVVHEKKDMYRELLQDANLDSILIVFAKEGRNSFLEFLEEDTKETSFVPEKANNVNDTAVIVFTSGTTGLAKSICLSHFVLYAQGKYLSIIFNLKKCLLFASLHWIHGVSTLISCIVAGTTRILARSFTAFDSWRSIAKFKATTAVLAAYLAIDMVKAGKPDYIDTNSLSDLGDVLITGSTMASKYLLTLREILPNANITQIYGQTEVAGVAILFRSHLEKDLMQLQSKPKSCGRPMPGFWYKVVDLDTERTLGCNEIGELRLKAKTQLNGYYNLDSSEAWDSKGWLKTGDVCYYDEDYCFYMVDQVKEMLNYKSFHIAPTEVESILLEHSAVKVAAVIGLPHSDDGEHLLGVVVLSEKTTNVTEEMLVKYVNERVNDEQQLRGGIKFVTGVPYTPTGKIRRLLLRESILKDMAR